MTWPTVPVITTGMDADTDALPRSDILDLTTKFNLLITTRAVANGVCDLDGNAKVPNARLAAKLAALAALDATPGVIEQTGADTFAKRAIGTGSNEIPTNSMVPQSSLVTIGADVINSNATANTLQDVTGLSFPVLAGATYEFEFVIPYSSAAALTGSRWAINGPALTALVVAATYTTVDGGKPSSATLAQTAYDTGILAEVSLVSGNMATIKGLITCSAAGNVIARFASEVASSAITAKAGAYVLYRKR